MIYLFIAGFILATLTTVTIRATATKRAALATLVTMIHTFISLSALVTIVNVDDLLSKIMFIAGTGVGTYLVIWYEKT